MWDSHRLKTDASTHRSDLRCLLACVHVQAPFSKPQQQQLAKDLGALSTLVRLHLAASGQPAYNFVEFISHKRKYILATDAGIAARCRVGRVEALVASVPCLVGNKE